MEKIDIQILDTDLVPQTCVDFVTNPSSGGIDVFIGTVRNQTKGKRVVKLDFEAYIPMAISEMKKIAVRACEQWPIEKISIHCLLYTSPSPRDATLSRMPSSA